MKRDLNWQIADVKVDNFDSYGTMSYRARAMIPMLQPRLKVSFDDRVSVFKLNSIENQ